MEFELSLHEHVFSVSVISCFLFRVCDNYRSLLFKEDYFDFRYYKTGVHNSKTTFCATKVFNEKAELKFVEVSKNGLCFFVRFSQSDK